MSQEAEERLAGLEKALRDICYGVLGSTQQDGSTVQVCILCRLPRNQPHAIGCSMSRLFAGIEVTRPTLLLPAGNGKPTEG